MTAETRPALARALDRAAARHDAHVTALRRFVSFASVSGDPARAASTEACARWLAGRLEASGLRRARLLSGARHPWVYAEWTGAPGRPTVLFYGHYDVKPAGASGDWARPPFAAVIAGGAVHGRGASDDKGQIMAQIGSLDAWLSATGRLPVNVKCLYDGAEEIGSPGLRAFLRAHARRLAADVAVICDTAMPHPEAPALVRQLRGSVGLEIVVRRRGRRLHSGRFGGAAINPLAALARAVASVADVRGRLRGPGRRPGVAAAALPALTLTRLDGDGGSGAIPARARATLDLRVPPDLDIAAVERAVRRDVAAAIPPRLALAIDRSHRVPGFRARRGHWAGAAARRAIRRAFGRPAAALASGGTIPAAAYLQRELGIEPLLIGFAGPEDRAHAANERFALDALSRGTACLVHLLAALARAAP